MAAESSEPASTSAHAVFLSYASQDAEAAQHICAALRSKGVEVWFDQSELRGGDAWDQSIRRQIKSCALFIPIISKNTHDRDEGYFRLEWKLAVDRSHLISVNKAFLLPVVIDDTGGDDDQVPERFRDVQWTRLNGDESLMDFVERVRRLLSPEGARTPRQPAIRTPMPAARSFQRWLVPAIAVMLLTAAAYIAFEKFSKPKASSPTVAASGAPAFNPPAHSIAVLPFVNMSGDKEQDYFSDGLAEELLNSLAQINELQVAARTSAFSFKGTNTDIGTIARKLNVGAVLEGSVRRSGNTMRITAQLINAVTGFHLWSHSYDRDSGDVLQLETEIAGAVAGALEVTLLSDVSAKIELGGTRNPAAFDLYLRGRKALLGANGNADLQVAITAFTQAIRLDPDYSLAYANRSIAFATYAGQATGPDVRENFDKAQADARRSIALTPDLNEGHMALALYFERGALDFTQANQEYERSLALAPGDARVLRRYATFAARMGRSEAAIAAGRRAVVLDPLSRNSYGALARILSLGRRNQEALAAFQEALALDPKFPSVLANRGFAYYAQGEYERARVSCESTHDTWSGQYCLAITYDKIGRHADAQAMLATMKASLGEALAYQYATIYTQWGDRNQALQWLDTATRLRDPGLEELKTDPLMEPLLAEPRVQALIRELKFPP
jgi:TolB-like protein/tetratricopeptide (TPR) repeat protein